MVTLMHHTPLQVCSHAVRTCWQSFGRSDDGGPKDRDLVDKVGNKLKHASTLEHLTYTFYIQGISRALLQELARHRIASLSVKSTRYTLKELGEVEDIRPTDKNAVGQFCVLTGNIDVDSTIGMALAAVQAIIKSKVPNDVAKFAIPDAYKTELTWTINARSLQNFLSLRTAPSAMWEIRRLACAIHDAIPEDHRYLYTECVHAEGEAVSERGKRRDDMH